MLKKLLFGAMVTLGLCATGGEAKAQHRCGGGYYSAGYRTYAPYYGSSYYATPYAGYAYGYSGYGPYYNYGYRYYAAPAVVYPAPVYYGPRVGVTYATPRLGVSVGF